MEQQQSVKDIQSKILIIIKYIDKICRNNNIKYYIMGGTALGAVRHGGFIPWDDDLDIFMTPSDYRLFKKIFEADKNNVFTLQEWRTTPDYLEYAKLRLNGTTFIEEVYKDNKDMHHGIFVDIMMLHKVPDNNSLIQKIVYYKSKFVTLYALSLRNWKPKTIWQEIILTLLKLLPCRTLSKLFYKHIYKYDNLKEGYKWCYWITPAGFRAGLFSREFFDSPVDVSFEDTVLLGPNNINEYLEYRYGDYMKLPTKEQQEAAVHAIIFDTNKDYKDYFK